MPDDAWRAVAELAASQHRAFTRLQAASLKFDRRRVATAIRHGSLTESAPNVLVLTGSPSTWEQRLMIMLLASNGHAVVSHRAAARLHGLDGFDHPGMAVIEASVTRSARLDLADAVAHHVTPLEDVDRTTMKGFPCTTIGRTLADLGAVVDKQFVRRALTSARRKGVGLTPIRRTAERLHRPGPTGTGTLLRLLDAVPCEGRVPDSWLEELLAMCLDDRSLPPVVAQCPILDADGRMVARTDLGIPSVKLGLGAHSRRFHFGPISGRLDEERDLAVAACGWELLYLGWHATRRPAEVLEVVRRVVAARSCELSVQGSAR
jgi:hypothetical protein